ncbi:DUF4214 domain-containing protein [Halomonas sp. HMF6819]|uniref:DUF4214 domain-containing protein n=1 Tax=Halomonas sp. HMF6819 TaxID=3373085 RepID=UPI00379EE4ED
MAQTYKAGLIITGDASGGIRAIKATEDELGKLNQGFDRGARQSKRFGSDAARAGQQVAEIDKGAGAASRGLDVLHSRVTGVAAAIATAFGAGSVVSQARLIADTDSLARSIGIATGELQAWDYAAQQAGLAGGKIGDILKDITERIGEFTAEGTGEAAALFENLNLSIEEMKRLAPDQQLLKIADAISTLETRGEQISYLERLGSDATLLLPLLDDNAAKLRELTSEAKAMGVSMSQIDIDNALEANRAITELSGTVEGLTNQVVADLGPGLAVTVDNLTSFIEESGGASNILNELKDVAVATAALMAGRYAAAFASSAKQIASNIVQTVANTRANVVATAAARAKAAEVLRVAQAEQTAAARALANGHAIAAATGNTTLRSKAITQMAAANQRAIAAEAAHTAAVNASAVAMQRNTAAAYAMAVASRAASGALALIGGPVGAAVLAGTAAYYFRDSLGFTSAAAREAKQDIDQLVDSMDNYTRAQYESNRVSIVQDLAEARIEAEKLAQEILSLQEKSRDEGVIYQGRGGAASSQLPELRAQLQEQQRIVRANEEGLRKYDQAWKDVLESQVSGVSIFRTLDQWLMTTGDSTSENARRFNALGDTLGESGEKWDDYIGKLQAARDVMGMTAAESAQYAAAQAGYTGLYADQAAAVAGQTDALSDYQKAIAEGNAVEAEAHLARAQRYAEAEAMVQAQLQNIGTLTNLLQGVQTELSATALSAALVVADGSGAVAANVAAAIQAINDRAAAIRNTTTVTVKNTAANRDAQKAARDAEQAAEKQADALESIREEMDPLIRDHKTYIDRVNVLEKALAAGTITQTEFAEAIRWSAEQYTRAASGAEDYERQTESLIGKYDSLNQRAQTLRTELDQIRQRYQAGVITGEQYERMVAGVREQMKELSNDTVDAAFTMEGAWDELRLNGLRRLDDGLADLWQGAIDGSRSASETMKRVLDQTLAEMAHMAITRPIMVQIAGSMGMNGGAPGAAPGGGFNLGQVSSLRNGWQAVQNGFGGVQWGGVSTGYSGGFAGSATNGVGVASQGTSYLGGSMRNFSGMQGLTSAGAGFAGGYAGTQIGQSLFGKEAGSSWGATGGALVGTYFGGPIGSAIGGAIGGAIDSLFGSGKKTFDFDFAQGGNYGVFGDRETALGQFGITSFSDYKLEQQPELDALLNGIVDLDNAIGAAALPTRLDAIKASIQGFAHDGPEDLVETRLRAMISGSQSAMADAVMRIADPQTLATTFVGVLQLERLGEQMGAAVMNDIIDEINRQDTASGVLDASNAMQSAAQAALVLRDASERLNLQFDATAAGAIHVASNLAAQVGGEANLNALLSSYYDAFYTEEEKFNDLSRSLEQTFAGLGRELPDTREGVRDLVESIKLMGATGTAQTAAILRATPALKQYIDTLEQQRQAAAAAAEQTPAPPPPPAFSYSQIVGIDGAISDYNSAIALADELASQRKRQLQDEQRAFDQLGQMLDSLMLSDRSVLNPFERMVEAQRQYAQLEIRAQAGDTEAVAQLQSAADQYLDSAAAVYGQASSQYAMVFGDVSSSVSSLESQFGASVAAMGSIESIDRQQLREQQQARDTLTRSLNEEIKANAELNTLTDLMGALPENLAQALSKIFPSATTASGRTYTPGGLDQEGDALLTGATGIVADSYREIFGRDPDDSGYAYWQSRYNNGASIDEIRESLRSSKEYVDGSHATGLPRVPFDGYIAELHRDEAVLNRDEADEWRRRSLPDMSALRMAGPSMPMVNTSRDNTQEALLNAMNGMRADNRQLAQRVQQLEGLLASIAGNTGKLLDPARRTAAATEETERNSRLRKRNPA